MPQLDRRNFTALLIILLLPSIFLSSFVWAESETLQQRAGPVVVQRVVPEGFQNQADDFIVRYTFYPNGSLLVWNNRGDEFFFAEPKFQPVFSPVVTLFENSSHVAQHFWVNGSQVNPQGMTEVRTLDLWVYFKFMAQNAKITLTGTTNDSDSEVEYEFENPRGANIANTTTSYTIGGITFDWSDLEGATTFEFAVNKLKVKFSSSFNLDPNIVSTCTATSATASSNQRKLFYANGYWHAFYSTSLKFYHRGSTDGGSWSDATSLGWVNPSQASAWDKDANVYIVTRNLSSNYPLTYYYGALTSNGEFSLTASNVLVGYYTNSPNIAADSAGLPYAIYHNTSLDTVQVSKSTTATTWTTAASYPVDLASSTAPTPSIVPLTNQKMFAVYNIPAEMLFYSRYYDGSTWQAAQLVNSTQYGVTQSRVHSLVAIDDTAYFAYYTSSAEIQVLKWTASIGWSNIATISNRDFSLSLSTAGSNLYLFTTATDRSAIHWRKYVPSTNSWGTDATEDDPLLMHSVTSLYEQNSNSETAFLYTTHGPYYVKFRKVLASEVPQTYEEQNPPSSSTEEPEQPEEVTPPTNQTVSPLPFVLPRLGTYGIFIGVGLVAVGGVMYAFRGSSSSSVPRRRRSVSYAYHSRPARSVHYQPVQPRQKRRYV